jgi:glutamate receptor, ionotropic, invertebrate
MERTDVEEDEAVLSSIENKTFVIAVRAEQPYVFYREKDRDGNILNGNERFSGYAIDLIAKLQVNSTQFKYTFFKVGDNKVGVFDKDKGTWNGLIGEILAGRADLAIADLTITYDRKKVVDFTNPFMNLGIGILYTAKPDKKTKSIFSFLDPFVPHVWYYTGLAYLLISVLVFILSRINKDDWESSHPCNQEPEELESIWNILNCVWLMMGSIMGQGSDILPK